MVLLNSPYGHAPFRNSWPSATIRGLSKVQRERERDGKRGHMDLIHTHGKTKPATGVNVPIHESHFIQITFPSGQTGPITANRT